MSAADLSDGSTTVTIQGEPTALKDQSKVSTSSGDEGGTQGGGVLTHKTKGKAVATFWSLDVKLEGKNAVRHGDPFGQNTSTPPYNGLDPSAMVTKAVADAKAKGKTCPRKYTKADRHGSPTDAQKDHVNKPPVTCWECTKPITPPPRAVADHQPPCLVKYYAGGCQDNGKDPNPQRAWARSNAAVKAHCRSCSSSQGGHMSALSKTLF
jgi:uncharacterized Zn-binding protein involved in type VI secretion